ncbi:MAG: hypothetical protein V8Q30_14090 [Acutalibacteraceae bacterium]
MRPLSLFERFNAFVSGVFDLTALVYYLSVILFFLFLTVQSLEKRRYQLMKRWKLLSGTGLCRGAVIPLPPLRWSWRSWWR